MSNSSPPFRRAAVDLLAGRLAEPRRFIHAVLGPRQVGKTTAVLQAVEQAGLPALVVSADEPQLRGADWLDLQWERARDLVAPRGDTPAVLVLDEVQKLPQWSEAVKRRWDEDTRAKRPLHVVVLGSAPLLLAHGLSESLAGRLEPIPMRHWSWPEMRDAFGLTLDQYCLFGGYPGAAPLRHDADRWRRYVRESLIEPTIARDVLLLTRVEKSALLRRLFELAVRYSGQVLSYTKMLGQLQDAGNAVTLAHYLDLLDGAGLVRGLSKYAGDVARQRGSSPKLQVLNTALMTALDDRSLDEWREDREAWGRLVESAVGAHLANAAAAGDVQLHWWRERTHEVDFVLSRGRQLVPIEVKSGRAPRAHAGTAAFRSSFPTTRALLVGDGGVTLDEFLSTPPIAWVPRTAR